MTSTRAGCLFGFNEFEFRRDSEFFINLIIRYIFFYFEKKNCLLFFFSITKWRFYDDNIYLNFYSALITIKVIVINNRLYECIYTRKKTNGQ